MFALYGLISFMCAVIFVYDFDVVWKVMNFHIPEDMTEDQKRLLPMAFVVAVCIAIASLWGALWFLQLSWRAF